VSFTITASGRKYLVCENNLVKPGHVRYLIPQPTSVDLPVHPMTLAVIENELTWNFARRFPLLAGLELCTADYAALWAEFSQTVAPAANLGVMGVWTPPTAPVAPPVAPTIPLVFLHKSNKASGGYLSVYDNAIRTDGELHFTSGTKQILFRPNTMTFASVDSGLLKFFTQFSTLALCVTVSHKDFQTLYAEHTAQQNTVAPQGAAALSLAAASSHKISQCYTEESLTKGADDVRWDCSVSFGPKSKVYRKCCSCSQELLPSDSYYGRNSSWTDSCSPCRKKNNID
jgi:hypothetical protein